MMQKTKRGLKAGLAAMAVAGMTSIAAPGTAADSWESGAVTTTISPEGQDWANEKAALTGSAWCGPFDGLCESLLKDAYDNMDCGDSDMELTTLPDGVQTAKCV